MSHGDLKLALPPKRHRDSRQNRSCARQLLVSAIPNSWNLQKHLKISDVSERPLAMFADATKNPVHPTVT